MKIKYKFGEHFHEGTNQFYFHVIAERPYEDLTGLSDYNEADDVQSLIDDINKIVANKSPGKAPNLLFFLIISHLPKMSIKNSLFALNRHIIHLFLKS